MSERRILVVEDDAAVRDLVARHLERKGYDVAQASDAEQVLLRMSRDRAPFDLVLTDVHLPGLSGVELLRLLLTHSPLRPVIMITGDADEGLARRALSYGAAGYLLKPFQLFELDAVVRQAIARLELVEAAGSLARPEVPARADGGGVVPAAWLELADARSSGGAGHGHRVARIAGVIGAAVESGMQPEERAALDVAGRAHELGRLLGPAATETELATRTGQLLHDLGVEQPVVRIVKNMREHWDGSGGPAGRRGDDVPLGSRVLAAADALDHAAVAHLESRLEPAEAAARALAEVNRSAKPRYGENVTRAVAVAAGVIEAIWVLARGPTNRSLRQWVDSTGPAAPAARR